MKYRFPYRLIAASLVLCHFGMAEDAKSAKSHADSGGTTQVQLAQARPVGAAVPKDFIAAATSNRSAAKLGNADGMFNIASTYEKGEGVKANPILALAWYSVAAEFGSKTASEPAQALTNQLPSPKVIAALVRSADLLSVGDEVPAKPEAAARMLTQAVSMGSREANIRLAHLYLVGNGVPADPARALKICQDGALHNLPSAMTCLGDMYQTGKGLPQDNTSALNWYRKGADCGDPRSIYGLARMYQDGSAGAPDKVLAYTYFLLASSVIPQSLDAALALRPQLSEQDRQFAEKKVDELLPDLKSHACQWND
jgi:TPR repeat protein